MMPPSRAVLIGSGSTNERATLSLARRRPDAPRLHKHSAPTARTTANVMASPIATLPTPCPSSTAGGDAVLSAAGLDVVDVAEDVGAGTSSSGWAVPETVTIIRVPASAAIGAGAAAGVVVGLADGLPSRARLWKPCGTDAPRADTASVAIKRERIDSTSEVGWGLGWACC